MSATTALVRTNDVRLGDPDPWQDTAPCLRRDPADPEGNYACLAPKGHAGQHVATDGTEVFRVWAATDTVHEHTTRTTDEETPVTTISPARPRPVAPIVCRPWCRDGDGHGSDVFRDDQRCDSDADHIPRSLAPKWQDTTGQWHAAELEVYCQAGPTYHPAVVVYSLADDDDFELRLTAAEARSLARSIMETVDLLEETNR